MPVYLAIAVGGALGALARYETTRVVEARVVSVFPWDTLAVNLLGCLFARIAVGALVDRHDAPAWLDRRAGRFLHDVLGPYARPLRP